MKYDDLIAGDQSYNVRKRTHFAEYISKMDQPHILELGVLDGASLFWLGREAAKMGGTVTGVDCFDETPCYPGHHHWSKLEKSLHAMIQEEKLTKVITLVKAWTNDYASKVPDKSLDLIHIDAGHTLKAAMDDTQNYLPKMKAGGVIFWDDSGWNDNGVMTIKTAMDWAETQGVQIIYNDNYAIGIVK